MTDTTPAHGGLIDHVALGDVLLAAHESRRPVPPLTQSHPEMTVEDAYRVQLHTVTRRVAAGRRVIGYKVGLTSKVMQQMLQISTPDFGHLFDDMVFDPFEPIDLSGFIAPRIEPEISFVLAHDLTGPGLTKEDVIAAIGHAVISLEIIDSRVADWKIRLADTIADNASSGGVIVGEETIAIDAVDLAELAVTLFRNGEQVGEGLGSAVLGHPVEGIVWLANALGALGTTLDAGSLVMAGSITAAVDIRPGDSIRANFGPLGELYIEALDARQT